MEYKEYRFPEKKQNWPIGQWTTEPDKIQWQDEETGMPCLIVRTRRGALCGYVGVAENHPAFQINYDDVQPHPDVHGGLTFSDFCQIGAGEQGICHIPGEGEPDRIWWLGFDCAHGWDVVPGLGIQFYQADSSYKDIEYVKTECQILAKQLKEMANVG